MVMQESGDPTPDGYNWIFHKFNLVSIGYNWIFHMSIFIIGADIW